MTRKLIYPLIVLGVAIVFETMNLGYYDRSLISSLLLAAAFVAYVTHDVFFRGKAISRHHIILGVPIAILLVLMTVGGMIGLSQVWIWAIFAAATVLSLGLVGRHAV